MKITSRPEPVILTLIALFTVTFFSCASAEQKGVAFDLKNNKMVGLPEKLLMLNKEKQLQK